MNINIKYKDTMELMLHYCNILNPVFKLKPKERLVLAVMLKTYYNHKHLTEVEISNIMFNKNVRKEMRDSIKMSEASFNNMFTILRKKEILLGDKINPRITKNLPNSGSFSINYLFNEQSN